MPDNDNAQKTAAQELAELREKLAVLAERKAARDVEYEAKREIEKKAREFRDEEAIAAAEDKHGQALEYGSGSADGRKLAIVRTDLGAVVLKRPNHILFKRFQDSGEANAAEFDKLVRPCLVHPDSATFDRYLEDQPAILGRCAGAVATLAGIRMKELSGKS